MFMEKTIEKIRYKQITYMVTILISYKILEHSKHIVLVIDRNVNKRRGLKFERASNYMKKYNMNE